MRPRLVETGRLGGFRKACLIARLGWLGDLACEPDVEVSLPVARVVGWHIASSLVRSSTQRPGWTLAIDDQQTACTAVREDQ
jgi:hypothetical protein